MKQNLDHMLANNYKTMFSDVKCTANLSTILNVDNSHDINVRGEKLVNHFKMFILCNIWLCLYTDRNPKCNDRFQSIVVTIHFK